MAQRYGKRIQPERNAKGSYGTGRVHAYNPKDWGNMAATDFWANFSDIDIVPAGSEDLAAYGWTEAGTWANILGSGADLLSSDDVGVTGGANFPGAGDALQSPKIFGDYTHALLVEKLLGYPPTSLNFECYARFAANANEEETGFGFLEAGAAMPAVKAGLMAFITSDGTNFSLESGAAVAVSDDLDDTTVHLWRVQLTAGGSISWWIDDVEQTNTLALQTDLFPVSFVISVKAATGSNDPVISWVHIWYE